MQDLFGQQSPNNFLVTHYRKGLDLYDHQSFGAADILFKKVFEGSDLSVDNSIKPEKENELKVNARFYSIFCELELHIQNSDHAALALVEEYPNSPLVYTTYFHLGNYFFFKKEYVWAFMNLEKADPNALSPAQLDEYNFGLGYCYFATNRYEQAQIYFSKLTNKPSDYREDALYYSGHLSFVAKDYNRALAQFSSLNPKGKYWDIKPIYVNQIYLIQRRFDAVIDSGKAELTKHKNRHTAEMNRLIGSAYFFKKDFSQAAGYFEQFKKDTAQRIETTQNRYQIGYTFYKIGEYARAIQELRPLYEELDGYAQNGIYTLGLCYLKLGQNTEARNAFRKAITIPGEPEVIENALSYYIKISYELGFNGEALSAAKSFSERFPNSASLGEIKTLEGELLMTSKNYPEAYQTLKEIKNRSLPAEMAFQKVAYYTGLEQYNLNRFTEASTYLEEALNHPQNKGILALANYWEGESQYELKNYDQAIQHYESYFSMSDNKSSVWKDALYGEGYAYFKKGNYPKALSLFEKLNAIPGIDNNLKADLDSRRADCFFMLREYSKANFLYHQNTIAVSGGQDYALYQSATIQGLQNNLGGKIKTLQSLLSEFPKSTYADKAQFEIASAYLTQGNSDKAMEEFIKVQTHYPTSSYVPKSILTLGIIAFNNNKDEEALSKFKQVVDRYPGSSESKSALASIKNIYLQKNDASGFINYAGTLTANSVSENAQDSITYQSGNQQFLSGNYQGSIPSFNFYLEKFPNGHFATEAHYNRAKSLIKLGRMSDTRTDFEYLSDSTHSNPYQEESEINLSSLYLNAKEYTLAIPILHNLTQNARLPQDYGFAVEGLLKAFSGLGNQDSTILFAQKLKEFTKSTPYQLEEAGLYGGKAFLAKGDTIHAQSYLNPVIKSSRSVLGAESRYLSAQLQYKNGNYKASQKILFDLIRQLPGFDYWVGKSFILLADNYLGLGDTFQAKGTLQSLVDHYSLEDDVKKLAREKLSQLQTAK